MKKKKKEKKVFISSSYNELTTTATITIILLALRVCYLSLARKNETCLLPSSQNQSREFPFSGLKIRRYRPKKKKSV